MMDNEVVAECKEELRRPARHREVSNRPHGIQVLAIVVHHHVEVFSSHFRG